MIAWKPNDPSAPGFASTVICAAIRPRASRPSSSATISGPKVACEYGIVPRAMIWLTMPPALQSAGAPERGNSTVGGRMPTLMNAGLLLVVHPSCDSDSLCQPGLGSTEVPG